MGRRTTVHPPWAQGFLFNSKQVLVTSFAHRTPGVQGWAIVYYPWRKSPEYTTSTSMVIESIETF